MGYSISYVCISHQGFFRNSNQDNFLCGETFLPLEHKGTAKPLRGNIRAGKKAVFGIFDGMGGGRNGEAASYLAARSASRIRIGFRPLDALLEFCSRANHAVLDYGKHLGIDDLGTTATLLSFHRSHVQLCHLGDSRAYRFRNGRLTLLTQDQVLTGYPGRKAPLTQYLGMSPEDGNLEPFHLEAPLEPEDIYLICSDGLTDMLTGEEIRDILSAVPFSCAAEHLLNTALLRGGRDNVTLILCKNQVSSRIPTRIDRLFSGGII